MKKFIVAIAVAILSLGSLQASAAEELTNVKNFDASLLVGKTCKGSFTNGGTGERSLGGVILKISQEEKTLTAVYFRKFGQDAFKGLEFDKPFENTGKVSSISVEGKKITYATRFGSVTTLLFDNNKLKGETSLKDCASCSDRTQVMQVELECQ